MSYACTSTLSPYILNVCSTCSNSERDIIMPRSTVSPKVVALALYQAQRYQLCR